MTKAADKVLSRLVARGLHDEFKGSAYAIVKGVDGRTPSPAVLRPGDNW
jgi:type IV secretory pathway VirD2 relaxase